MHQRTIIRWTPETFAVVEDVRARGFRGKAFCREVERRLGLEPHSVDGDSVRKAYDRTGRKWSMRDVAPSTQPSQRAEEVGAGTTWPAAPPSPAVTADRSFIAPPAASIKVGAHERVLVIPDVHIPCHDQAAVDLAIAVGFRLRPTAIVVLGDTLDFAPLSFHQRTKKVHSLREEVDGGRTFFRALEQIGAQTRVFVGGNHEARLDRYIHGNAAPLADLDGFSVDELLGLSVNGWKVVAYHDGIKLGGVYYTHEVGHCGIHAVRTSGERMAQSVVIGHVHSLTGTELHSIDGVPRSAWSFGWLGDRQHIDYRHRTRALREWPHAVGVVYGDEHENAWASPIVMRDGSRVAYVHGQAVRA